jgi:thiol-disulfide isomerase/thioredoxin
MYKMIFILATVLCNQLFAQAPAAKPSVIYGKSHIDTLRSEPHNQWFTAGYDSYIPDHETVNRISKQLNKDISVEIFFGSWCGDSKREVPRFIKLADALHIPQAKLVLIGLGSSDSLYKQSPDHEEAGKGIFRVPTFIFYNKGKEIARINEFPVNSLEKDVLAILEGNKYEPNYRTFATVKSWMDNGALEDENISPSGLAGQLLGKVKNEHELNSLGYLLLAQGRKKEALRIFQTNFYLFPESANVLSSLGEGYLENKDSKKAVTYLERSLALNQDPGSVTGILSVLYKAWLQAGSR